jgi:hypothetical protein
MTNESPSTGTTSLTEHAVMWSAVPAYRARSAKLAKLVRGCACGPRHYSYGQSGASDQPR